MTTVLKSFGKTEIITFTIPGRISGWARARIDTRKGPPLHFMDKRTAASQGVIKHFASEAMKGSAPIEGPCSFSLLVYIGIPKSWSKKKKAQAFHVTGKPDCDNLIKQVSDSLNGIIWRDDSQITDIRMKRRYTLDQERVEIVVTDLSRPIAIARECHESHIEAEKAGWERRPNAHRQVRVP